MTILSRLFTFPVPFLRAFPPVWLALFLSLVSADLISKKLVTESLNFHLSPEQHRLITNPVESDALLDGRPRIDVLGPDGDWIKLRLVFNDRFVFGAGPSAPVVGFFLTLIATLLLLAYRWHNYDVGHSLAWLFVFSGALGNLIDKMFLKSLASREWVLGLTPRPGHVGGVVDFVECIWFGWDSMRDVFGLNWLAWRSWPTFNLADSLIVVGICLLILTMSERRIASETKEAPGSP
ncbi:MAG: signal peptidase II [Spirochaetales bacterium]|nr:signal peptidase II [Leptospiraceae bacterium]MCP5483569.1 signal peptidase II [Spirochaetales bacterium]MCP5486423.1 signal peptidase II [Spirochaetales bacterium]